MVLLKKRKKEKQKTKNPRKRLKLRQKIKIKLLEWPALHRAKKEEKQHIPTLGELKKETHEFEEEAVFLRSLIRKKVAVRKRGKRY